MDLIQEILSLPKGKSEDKVKIWQEINRYLRKELEALSQETFLKYSTGDVSPREQYKIGYMLTLSSNSEIRAKGAELYCQALSAITGRTSEPAENETVEAEQVEYLRIEDELAENEQSKDEDDIELQDAGQLRIQIKTLENKLLKANMENQRTRGQLEKLKNEMTVLKAQWVKEKQETENYHNQVRNLEEGRINKEKEIENLKLKLEQTNITAKTKEQSISRESAALNDLVCSEIDFAAFRGRKALIFAEHDYEIDIRLSALGIIPIWAMEIDWNRPRRRMSTCELVLYKRNNKIIKKIEEIRDVAKYWNIPCSEFVNISRRGVHD